MSTPSMVSPLVLVAVLALGGLPGCGGPHDAQVSGIVTLDAVPLDTGTVTFYPVASGPPAYGSIQPGGRYRLQTGNQGGLPSGTYRVVVVATEVVEFENDPLATAPPITPEKYARLATTDLTYQITPGPQEIPLKLRSQ